MTRWHKTWRFHPWWGGTHLFFVGLFHFDNIDSMEEEKKEIILRFASLKFQLQGVFTKRWILVSSKFCVLTILETIHSTFKSISECFYFICIPIKLKKRKTTKRIPKKIPPFFWDTQYLMVTLQLRIISLVCFDDFLSSSLTSSALIICLLVCECLYSEMSWLFWHIFLINYHNDLGK